MLSAQLEEITKSNTTVSAYLERLTKPSSALSAQLEELTKSNATVSAYLESLTKPNSIHSAQFADAVKSNAAVPPNAASLPPSTSTAAGAKDPETKNTPAPEEGEDGGGGDPKKLG